MTKGVSTRTVLVLLVILAVVPLALFAAFLIQLMSAQQRALIERQNINTARAISAAIDQEVTKTTSVLALIGSVEFSPADTQSIGQFHHLATGLAARQAGWRSLTLIDSAGRRLASTAADDVTGLAGAVELIREVRTASRPIVSNVIVGASGRPAVVLVAEPLMSDHGLRGILVAEIAAKTFGEVLRRQQPSPNGVVTLLDRSRRIVARTQNEAEWVGQSPTARFQDAAARMAEGTWRDVLLEGVPAYAALSRSVITGWTLGVGLPSDTVDGPINRSLVWLAGAGIFTLVICLTGAAFFGRQMVRALDDCADAADALACERTFVFRRSAIREVTRVAHSMDAAVALRERRIGERDSAEAARAQAAAQRERALAAEQTARSAAERNEARLSVTLHSIGDAVIATDASGAITIMNPVAQALTGWTQAAALGHSVEQVFDIIDENTRQRVENPVSKVFGAGRIVDVADHTVLRRRDGREVPIEDSAAPIRSADGSVVGVVLVFRDRTKQRDEARRSAALLEHEHQAREEAETTSRSKDEFLATLSHELRTPLNAILGWTQMLRRGDVPAAGQPRVFEIIERNARVQTQLVGDLLDMSRVIRGHIPFDMGDVELADVVEAALDMVRPTADAKSIILALDNRLDDAVIGDGARLQQVFWNLLTNSAKFTPRGGRIEVRLFRDAHEAVAEVADTGFGIPAHLLPHVFERFWQGTPDARQPRGGLGIGLSLVKHLVELHGGTVSAASAGRDQGATFTVRLPILGPRAIVTTRSERDDDEARPLESVRILVVEDEEDSREMVEAALTRAGADCTLTASVPDAMQALELHVYDLVVMDITMPGPDGYELLKHLKHDLRLVVPVVALSARPRRHAYEQESGFRFTLYLEKPVEPQALVQAAAVALGRV